MSNLILNSVQFPGLDDIYINPNTARPNLLTNWYFIGGGSQQGNQQFPINSRGLTQYTGDGMFTIDRWWMRNTSNTGVPTVNVLSDGIQIIADGESSQGFNQSVEGFRNLAGKTVTASVLITQNTFTSGSYPSYPYFGLWNSTSFSTNNTPIQTVSLTGQGTGLFTCTVTCPQTWTNNYLNIGIFFASYTGTIKVSAFKLELGMQQTLARWENEEWVLNDVPNFEEELLKCQTAKADTTDAYANNTVNINLPNINLLRNWYFAGTGGGAGELPVNSRGQSIYTGAGYAIDGWYERNSMTATLQSDGLHLSFPSDDTSLKGLNQTFKTLRNYLVDKTVTLSVLIKDFVPFSSTSYPKFGLYSGSVVGVHTTPQLTRIIDGNGLFSVTGTLTSTILDSSNLNFTACYANSYSGSLTVVAAKMELGTQQTLAHQENGVWVLNEIPNYSEELYKCFTANDTADPYAGGKTVIGKLSAAGNPYLRFHNDGNTVYQFLVVPSRNLRVESYDGTSWSTVAEYSTADRFVTMLSDYVTLSSQTWTTWSGGNVYGVPISFTNMPSGYHMVSATLYQFANWPSGAHFDTFIRSDGLYALSTIPKESIGNCKLQYRVILEKD